MSALEQEIIEKFQRLNHDAKQRVLQTLAETFTPSFDYRVWWTEVDLLQHDIQSRIGEKNTLGTLSLLDNLREEES